MPPLKVSGLLSLLMGGGGRAGRVKSPVCCADRRPGYLRVAARKARTGAPAGAARCRAPSPGSEPAEATAGSPGKPRPGRRRPRGWAGRGASPARTLRLRSLRLPLSLTVGAPVEDYRGRRVFVPGGTEGLPLLAR